MLKRGGRLVVLGDHSGLFGIQTVNDLLGKLGVGIKQNNDIVPYVSTLQLFPFPTPKVALTLVGDKDGEITSDQITQDVGLVAFAATSSLSISTGSLSLSGGATSLLNFIGSGVNRSILAVDHIAGAPPGPGGDVVVCGDLDNFTDFGFSGKELLTNTTPPEYYNNITPDRLTNITLAKNLLLFLMDTIPPVISNVAIAPNPTRVNPTLTATMMDDATNIMAAEYFIDSTPPSSNVRGTPMFASDGTFDQLQENVTAVINIGVLTDGTHTVILRGEDAAGNWSSFTSTTFVVDRTPPVITITSPTPNQQFTVADEIYIQFTISDQTTGVASYSAIIPNSSYSISNPYAGYVTSLTESDQIDACQLNAGITYTLTINASDRVGNDATPATVQFTVISTTASVEAEIIKLLGNNPQIQSDIARLNQLQSEINGLLSGTRAQNSINALIKQANEIVSALNTQISPFINSNPCVANFQQLLTNLLAQVQGSVTIKGPPAICNGETATYTALGLPEGGDFVWSSRMTLARLA